MKFKKTTFYLVCLFSTTFIFGQIKVSEYIQQSTIATQTNNKLYFVDFWATWCGPCIHASKYIESLQKQYPDDFYVLSLSQESPEVVKRFMLKHQNGLATAIDYEGETFSKNKVQSLPYSILYNASGMKIWEGHPADFKPYQLEQFLRDNPNEIAVDRIILTQAYQKEAVKEKYQPKSDFEILALNESWDSALQIVQHDSFMELKGNLKDILAYALDCYKSQIILPNTKNDLYRVRFKMDSNAYENKAKFILKALKMKESRKFTEGEALIFEIKNPTFWDTNQIDWGKDTQQFLIGDSEIKADNVTLNQVKYQLSNVLETPIVIASNVGNQKHDWDIHYKYFDLMVSIMKDNYGIDIEKKVIEYPEYTITRRGRN
jgi:thiol-disulfide isomerase/thioredoxin